MKKIFINVDSYNSDGIKTIQGNNNAETYKIYLLKNKIRLSLVNKTVKLGYVMAGTTKGDIIEDLNITNAEQGEITFPITNKISKKDGVYTCQLAIYGADGFLEYTATFGLTVQANIFNKIANEIADNKDLTYIERILEEAINTSEELKSNIPVARQLNSDLENQNRILNENMDRANGVNTTLITTTEQSKVAATDAIEKKSQLESSIVKAKEFIDGLDGSQDIPSIRMELTKLQNGLKSNQALEYSGSSISANDTLEGRSEGMKVKGLTLQNLSIQEGYYINSNGTQQYFHFRKYKNLFKSGKYTLKNITGKALIWDISRKDNDEWVKSIKSNKSIVIELEEGQYVRNIQALTINGWILDESTRKLLEPNVVVLEGDKLNIIDNIPYFEGIKSFGEAEKEGDKYKIKLLSKNKNFFNKETDLSNWWGSHGELHKGDSSGKKYSILTKVFSGFKYIINVNTPYSFYTFLDDKFNVLGYGEGKNTQVAPVGTTKLLWYLDPGGIDKGLYNKIQVEPGTISTEYQSYQEKRKNILIKEPLREGDYLYEENGQVKVYRNDGQYTLTGNEDGRKEKTLSKITRFYIDTPCKNIINTRNIICNNFNSNGTWWDRDEIGMYWDTSIQGRLWFHIKNGEFNDFEAFRNFLKANKTTIVYQLDKPVIEVIENCIDIDLDTYESITYVNILNSLPGELDFKVPSNIGSSLQNLAKEVNNIWDVINNLLVPSLIETNKNIALATIKNNLK